MRMSSNHLIKQTLLDFQFNGNTDGFSFQREVREWFDGFLLEFSGSLDELTGEHRVISIDKLELEFELSASNWREQASQKIRSQFKEKILLMQKDQIDSSGYQEQSRNQQFAATFLF
jgi:Contractile injection system tape measure protein